MISWPARWRSSSSALIRSRRRVLTASSRIMLAHRQQRGRAAVLADLVAGGAVAVVEVAAGLAALDLGDVDAGAVVAGGQADPVDLVAGAFVVDERAGAELADGEEPRALDVVALAVAGLRSAGMNAASGSRGKE